ncbi:MAG: Ig-like domain-containing protein [Dehalococcoidales bacterium]|nr:Ig-like domain-containing protein [Dehalococcoidales bacterium]
MKKRILTIVLTLVLLVGIIATPATAGANGAPDVLMGFCLDSSGSISSSEWTLIKTGLGNVIGDPTIVPQDGSVEICIVKFSQTAQEVLVPTVVTDVTIGGILSTISGMTQMGSTTAMGAGILQTLTTMQKSANFNNPDVWKVINLATDGAPNVFPGGYTGKTYAEYAVNMTVAAGVDEFDIEGIGDGADNTWMAEKLAYPDGTGPGIAPIIVSIPPDSYPPRPPSPSFTGFVRACAAFEDYEEAVAQKLVLILKGLLSLDPPYDTNDLGDQHCVTATLVNGNLAPIPGATIDFEVTGVNPTTGSAVTDENGKAQFCYTGNNPGLDTIVATWDDTAQTGQLLESEPVEKLWIDEPPPPPVEVGGTIQPVNKFMLLTPWIALGILLAAFGTIIIRRRITQS